MARRTKKRQHRGTSINNKHNRNHQSNKRKVTQTGKRKVMTGGKKQNAYLPEEIKTTKMEINPLFNAESKVLNNSSNTNGPFEYLKIISPDVHTGLIGNTANRQLQTAEIEYNTAKRMLNNATQKSMTSLSKLYGYGEPSPVPNIYGEQSRMREPLYATVDSTNNPTPSNPIIELAKTSKPNTTPNYSLQLGRNISKMIESLNPESNNKLRLQQIRKKITSGNPLLQENKTYLRSINPDLSLNNNEKLSPSNVKPVDLGKVYESNPLGLLGLNPAKLGRDQTKQAVALLANYKKENPNLNRNLQDRITQFADNAIIAHPLKFKNAASSVKQMTSVVSAFKPQSVVAPVGNDE